MTRRSLLSAVVLLFTTLPLHAADTDTPGPKYNVLFLVSDDLRPELHCYGAPVVLSPNIDALAHAGLLFTRAYCQYSLCNPSRNSLLSGERPETLGIFDLKTNIRDKFPDIVTLPELFKDHGYISLSFGKVFHTGNGNHEEPLAWSEKSFHPSGYNAGVTKGPKTDIDSEDPHSDLLAFASPDLPDDELPDAKTAAAAIEAMDRIKDKPFFLAVGFYRPHLPFIAPKKYWDLYDKTKIPLADNPFLPKDAPACATDDAHELREYSGQPAAGPVSDDDARSLRQGYYASVSFMDAQLGKVVQHLDALGLRNKTIIVFWGDHGYQLGEHATWGKHTNWELGTRAPLMIYVPNSPSNGHSTPNLVEFVDVFPTLADLCHLPKPAQLQGSSFAPLLQTPDAPTWKSAAFSLMKRKTKDLGPVTGHAMRTGRYRYVEWTSKTHPDVNLRELYDEQSDPNENTNIANLPENKPLVESLAKQLSAGWKSAKPKED